MSQSVREQVKEVRLTKGRVALVDKCDYHKVACLPWFVSFNDGKLYAKHTSRGRRTDPRHKLYMHRLVLNAPSELLVDHINGNGLDNRRCNLRLVDAALNTLTARLRNDNTSGHRGVSWNTSRRKWIMQFKFRSQRVARAFTDKQNAINAYHDLLPFPCPACIGAKRPEER